MEKRRVNLEKLNEKKVCALVSKGDNEAFSFLYKKYSDGLIAFIYQKSQNRHLSEEICQLSWIKAFKKIKTFQGKSSFKTWIHRIAMNCLWDHYKKYKRFVDEGEVGGEFAFEKIVNSRDEQKNPFSHASELDERDKIRKKVRQVISELPKDKKETVELIFFDELSYQEVAERMNVPIGTVMSRMYYVRKRLKDALSKIKKSLSSDEFFLK